MLYKNGEPYRLLPNDVKTITEKFKKFPLIIKYPPERVKRSRTKENKTPDQPTSISFDLFATVKTKTGADLWRYAENVIVGAHGVKKYTPRKFRYTGLMVLKETDIELAWFLYTKSPYCQNGLNAGKSIKFMFEDKFNEAEARAEMESIRTTVKALIWGKELSLSEQKMRLLAKAYNINNVDDLSFNQVRAAIDNLITSDPEHGYQKFIDMTRMDELINTRVRLQNLIDAEIIIFDNGKRVWKWKEAEKGSELICKIAPAANPNDTLYDFFMGNMEFHEMVEIVEKTKRLTKDPE
jgi:hypothetical protein